MDTTNTAEAVQLGLGTLKKTVPEAILVSGIDRTVFKQFGTLANSWEYEKVDKLADEMDKDKFLKYLCQVVTTLDQFKGFFGYLKKRDMVPNFLVHGDMEVVRKVITETNLLETDRNFGHCGSISDAIVISLKEDNHGRVMGLFVAAHERPGWKGDFQLFVRFFLDKDTIWRDNLPLRRFLTLQDEEFNKNILPLLKLFARDWCAS